MICPLTEKSFQYSFPAFNSIVFKQYFTISFRLPLKDKCFLPPLAKHTVSADMTKTAMFDSIKPSGLEVILAPSCDRNSGF